MNDNIAGIPYSTAEFDKEGRSISTPTIPDGMTDVILVSHGWNNSRADAESLYQKLFDNFAKVSKSARGVAIVGVIWPSKKFDDFMTQTANTKVAGGAASAGAVDQAASTARMHEAIDLAAPLFSDPGDDARLKTLHSLVPDLEEDPEAQQRFVETLRTLLDPDGSHAAMQSRDDGADVFSRAPADTIFNNAAAASTPPVAATPEESEDPVDGVGRAASIGSFFSGAAQAVSNLLNLTTYFEMKKRAGEVGKNGVAPLIDKLSDETRSIERIHLVGHSFGGRVVSAAPANSRTTKLQCLALLEAAFSHFGFSQERGGFFRSAVDDKRIAGPIFITHTKNDTAVGLAYPTASRISRDNASAFGDANDEFGAIGSNGAQRMKDGEIFLESAMLLPVGQPYDFRPGKFHNLDSTKFIIDPKGGDAHGWVFVPEVAWAIACAMTAPSDLQKAAATTAAAH